MSKLKHILKYLFSKKYRKEVHFTVLREYFPCVDPSYSDCLIHNCPYRVTEHLARLPSEDK